MAAGFFEDTFQLEADSACFEEQLDWAKAGNGQKAASTKVSAEAEISWSVRQRFAFSALDVQDF